MARLPAVALLALLLTSGCAERAALEAEHAALTAELALRTAVMHDGHTPDDRSLKDALDQAVLAARAAVPPFDWPRLSQGLASFSSTGRYQVTDDAAELALEGPGDARYAAQAIAFTARLAPGLVLRELTLGPDLWRARGTLLVAPEAEYVADAPIDVPVTEAAWPWNRALVDENAALREKIRAADQTIGASPIAMEQKKLALARFVDAYESPGRMPFVSTWVEKLVPHMKRVTLVFTGRGVTLETEPIDPRITMDAVASTIDVGLVTTSFSVDEGRVKGAFVREERE